MNKNAIFLGLVTFFALICALFLGMFVAQGKFRDLGLIIVVVGLFSMCLILRANIWMIIPLCSGITGTIGFLPGNITISEIAILVAFGLSVVLSAMKAIPSLPHWNFYDKLLFVNLAYLVTVYARNPAGVLMFQTEIIGGRPYFAAFIAFLAYWVLQHVTLTSKQATLIPVLTCVGTFGSSLLSMVCAIFPNIAYKIYPIYTGVPLPGVRDSMDVTPGSDDRKTYLKGYAETIGPAMVAFRDPVRLLLFLSPFVSIIYYSAIIAALLSGFRSVVASLVVMTAISVYFRSGLGGVLRIALVVLAALMILIICQSAGFELPLPAQRSLSFLPGPWDQRVAADAQGSSDWRFEMWKQALAGDRYIRNKLLGDGFGFRAVDLQGFESMGGMQDTSPEQLQDYFLVVGAYHSGPVSAIRFVGVVGLLLMTIFMVACANYAWKLVVRSKRTPFFAMALFVCSPVIYWPISYWLIYGAADSAYAGFLINLGLLNLLSRSLTKWDGDQSSRSTAISH
ncbi:MAG: hypothetical protein WCS31_02580 [Verrucomicrobiae bacterium]